MIYNSLLSISLLLLLFAKQSISVSTPVPNPLINLSNNAKLLAQYTGATYCSDDTKLLAWDCPFHCKVLTTDSETVAILYNKELDVKGTLVKNTKHKFLVLAFRGSNSKVNWELNGKDTLVPINLGKLNSISCPNIKVHQGFQEATIGLRQYYCDSINKLYDQNPSLKSWPLFVVGHSLGGSIANLASVDLIYNLGLKNVEVYTFGQPRVGNKDFVQLTSSVIKTYIRAINGNDPVPILASSLKGYLHGPTEVHYLANIETNDSKAVMCSSENGEDTIGINSITHFDSKDHFFMLGIPFDNLCDDSVPVLKMPLNSITEQVNSLYYNMTLHKQQ